jgi:hypothetical protein
MKGQSHNIEISEEEAKKLAEETFVAFFSQFKRDEYTKLVLQVLFEELLNGKNFSLHGQKR